MFLSKFTVLKDIVSELVYDILSNFFLMKFPELYRLENKIMLLRFLCKLSLQSDLEIFAYIWKVESESDAGNLLFLRVLLVSRIVEPHLFSYLMMHLFISPDPEERCQYLVSIITGVKRIEWDIVLFVTIITWFWNQ